MTVLKNELDNPPYLEVAFDIPDWRRVEGIIRALPEHEAIVIEAGTPLIKRYGVEVCQKIHQIRPGAIVLADLKTLSSGGKEARMAAGATADVAAFSGLASIEVQEEFIKTCYDEGVIPLLDTINLHDPTKVLSKLKVKPAIVELHRAIDLELTGEGYKWGNISKIKEIIDGGLVAVAGGIKVPKVKEALKSKADILVVGRAITASKDVNGAAWAFLKEMDVR